MQYEQWFAMYLDTYKPHLRPRTREEYERLHRLYIAPSIGAIELTRINCEQLQETINAASAHGARTACAVYDLLRAVLRRAVRSRALPWSPIDALDRPAHTPRPGRALIGEDYTAACQIAADVLGVALALHAGLRRGEILALRWSDVDLRKGVLHVHAQQAGRSAAPPKSAAGVRDVPISPQLAALLRAQRQIGGRCVPCCASALDRRWAAAQRDAGIVHPYRLHDLRHTYATRLLLAGVPLAVVQYVVGHADATTTARIYIHVTPDAAASACAQAYAAASH